MSGNGNGNGKADLVVRASTELRTRPRASELGKEFWSIPSSIQNETLRDLYGKVVTELRAESLEMGLTSVADMMLVQHIVLLWTRMRDMELQGQSGTAPYHRIERSWLVAMGQLRQAQVMHADPFEMGRHLAARLNGIVDALQERGLLRADPMELRDAIESYATQG